MEQSNLPCSGSNCSQEIGTSRVLAWMVSMAAQTLGMVKGQALELWLCAPRIRKGAPSTINAWRLSFCTRYGSADPLAWATRQPVNTTEAMAAMRVKGEPMILFMTIILLVRSRLISFSLLANQFTDFRSGS